MADIQVRIKLNAGVDGDLISSVAFNQETNNVSKTVGSKTTKNDGQNLISWGEDGLVPIIDGYVGGATATLSKEGGYNGFVFGIVPSNKQYSVEVTLEGSNIDSVTFYGDKNANQFPTRAYLNGDTSNYIYNDDTEWTIVFPSASNSHTVTFDMWNRANYNACITHIVEFTNELVLDKRWIKSIESLSQSTGQPKEIYYGVTPSSGSIEIIDINGEIKDYIQDGILDVNNLKLDIMANGSIVSKQQCEDVVYNSSSQAFSASLTDSLLDSKNPITVNLRDYTNSSFITLKDILQTYVFDGKDIDNMLTNYTTYYNPVSESDITLTIDEYLQKIKLQYFHIFIKTKLEVLNFICEVAQIALVKISTGEYVFTSLRKKDMNTIPIAINKSNIFGQFNYDIVVNNRYNRVDISSQYVTKKRENVYDKTFSLKVEPMTASFDPYNVSAVGLDASLINYPGDITEYINFFDYLNYTETEYYNLDNARWSMIGSIYTGSNILKTKSIVLSESKKEEYSSSNNIPTSFGGSVYLLDASDNHDNNKSYDLAFNMDVTAVDPNATDNVTELYTYDAIQVKILADKYIINRENLSFGDGDDSFKFSDNPFISTQTFLEIDSENKIPITSVLSTNILKDYSEGVRTASVTVACLDYYDVQGNMVKDWTNGQIINVGDIVKVDGNKSSWRVTGRRFRHSGCPFVDLELQEVETNPLLTMSWEEIDKISRSGDASNVLSVGQEKDATLSNGRTLTFQIVGFNHDTLSSDGESKAGITWGMKDLGYGLYPMNQSNTNVGGWAETYMRNTVMAELFDMLPQDLQRVIKSVNKKYQLGNVSEISVSSDKLWLFADGEIYMYSDYDEGLQYEYYKKSQNLIKKLNNGDGSNYMWWLRTATPNNNEVFFRVREDGTSDGFSARGTFGVCVGFCI